MMAREESPLCCTSGASRRRGGGASTPVHKKGQGEGQGALQRHSHEGDAAARLVDLPHVELLVLLQRLLELGRREAAGDAALLRLAHADHLARAALCGQLAHQREDHVGGSLSPVEGKGLLALQTFVGENWIQVVSDCVNATFLPNMVSLFK